ncbi:hypothetical protein ACH5RR_008910 [Cinchona calisaya]|uniref:Uncharacterized protein n=1 Tax=Cinchona calisaya TaxID=153742 RepID=A0ABD3ADF2_9GENT
MPLLRTKITRANPNRGTNPNHGNSSQQLLPNRPQSEKQVLKAKDMIVSSQQQPNNSNMENTSSIPLQEKNATPTDSKVQLMSPSKDQAPIEQLSLSKKH